MTDIVDQIVSSIQTVLNNHWLFYALSHHIPEELGDTVNCRFCNQQPDLKYITNVNANSCARIYYAFKRIFQKCPELKNINKQNFDKKSVKEITGDILTIKMSLTYECGYTATDMTSFKRFTKYKKEIVDLVTAVEFLYSDKVGLYVF